MAILVTGGAGYIGSHTAVELLTAGYDIIIIDNFSNSKPEVLKQIEKITGRSFLFYQADILDKKALDDIFAADPISAVIHFAGLKAVGESVDKPLSYYNNNVAGTINLLQVMNRYNVKQMVFSSSATVYGDPETVPITEDFPLSAVNPYGNTKLIIEQILNDLHKSDPDWRIAILRYFNPIGAHKSGLIGEDPNGIPNNLMPYIVKVASGELQCLNVFGSDYPTPDGTGIRDYIHVVDLSLGHLKALEKITAAPGLYTYNLGTGKGYSVLQVIEAFEASTGQRIKFQIAPRRSGDIAECYANPDKARQELRWEASLGLQEMCFDAWKFAAKKSS
jgi:UDP-glucose 4-epimerase